MVSIRAGLVGTVVGQLELPGDVVVVLGHLSELLLQLGLHHHQLVVGGGQLVHLAVESVQLQLVILDDSQRLVVVGSNLLVRDIQLGQLLDGHFVLLHTGSKLPVDVLVGRGQLHDLLVLHLAGVLQLGIGLVGGIQRHLQLSDGDGHLLLDDLNLVLQPRLGLGKLPAENVDLVDQLLLVGSYSLFAPPKLFSNSAFSLASSFSKRCTWLVALPSRPQTSCKPWPALPSREPPSCCRRPGRRTSS